VDTLVVSTTRIIANKESWKDPWKREKTENLVTLLQGAIAAEMKVGLKMNIEKDKLDGLVKMLPAMKNPTISHLYDPNWMAVEIVVDEKIVRDLIPQLKRAGARDIIEYTLNKVIP
jgi:ATP phosphoribosyltransferase